MIALTLNDLNVQHVQKELPYQRSLSFKEPFNTVNPKYLTYSQPKEDALPSMD